MSSSELQRYKRHKVVSLERARTRSVRKKGHRFYIEASEDAGLTYRVVHSGDDLELLRDIGDHLDSEGLRWVIKGAQTGRIIDHCAIHQSIIGLMEGLQEKKDEPE